MDRRTFLGTAAGAGAIGWLGHYFLGRPAWAGPDDAVEAMGDVAEAYRRARGLGKPLLVLVIPADNDEKWARGQTLGSLLNHGGPGVYLDLALSELVCSTVADLRKQLPEIRLEGEPLMVLVETAEPKASATPIDPELPKDPHEFQKLDAFAEERLKVVAQALRNAVAPDKEAIARRAALAEARLPAADLQSLKNALAAKIKPTDEMYDRGAAIVRARAENPEHPAPGLADILAAAAKKRVTGTAPAGARWAKSSGCGVDVEGEAPEGVDCGMAFVPKIAQRFLWFYAKK